MRKAVKPAGVYDIGRLASVDARQPHGALCFMVARSWLRHEIMRGERSFMRVLGRGEVGETLAGDERGDEREMM